MHNLTWPVRHIQTCTRCGIKFPSLISGLSEREEHARVHEYRLDNGDPVRGPIEDL